MVLLYLEELEGREAWLGPRPLQQSDRPEDPM